MAGSKQRNHRGSLGAWAGDPAVFHGEGAFWDDQSGRLRYVDMLRGDVVTHGGGRDERTKLGDVAAMIRSRRAGGYVVATERGFALIDESLQIEQEIAVFDDVAVRMNEGACDAAGRLYCGSMAYDFSKGKGKLYRLDPDLSVRVVLDELTIPNGLVWAGGGSVALHADTADDAVYAYEFDIDTGEFGHRDVFIDFSDVVGSPDGMTLDAEGGLWVALWGGGAVHRYDARGALTDVIPLPVTNPTSVAIGGSAGTQLFVTTSRQGLGDRLEPTAGLVYTTEIGVRGAELHAFGG